MSVLTDQTAASGQRSLMITDAPGLDKTYNPHFMYRGMNYKQGRVVNAFHLATMHRMADLATALGKDEEAREARTRARNTDAEFQRQLFDPQRGLYRDGIGTDHVSLHANLFPLAGLQTAETKVVVDAGDHTEKDLLIRLPDNGHDLLLVA